jgi:plasmid stabilization system protein ParE
LVSRSQFDWYLARSPDAARKFDAEVKLAITQIVEASPLGNRSQKGKGHVLLRTWPLFMPATTYSPTHFRVQYNRPGGA